MIKLYSKLIVVWVHLWDVIGSVKRTRNHANLRWLEQFVRGVERYCAAYLNAMRGFDAWSFANRHSSEWRR